MSRLLVPLLLLILSQVGCSVESEIEATAAAPTDQNATLMAQAQAIHASALTLDAHADIEIPGKPSMYVGSDGLSKIAPAKMRAGGLNEKILRALVEAGAIKKIKITAEGSTIYVEAYTGSDKITAKTIKGKLKTWRTLDSAVKWVRALGIGQIQLDVARWQPEQKMLKV